MRDALDVRERSAPVPSARDLPGEVHVRVHPPGGRPCVTLRFGVLDPETRRIYWRLSEDGSSDPTVYMLERKFVGLDGVDVPADAARAWLAGPGLVVADAAIEAYVERSTLGREESHAVSLAAQALMIASRDNDPYEITDHAEECDEDVWEDFDRGVLVDRETLEERDCSACFFEHELWEGILEDTGSAEAGRLAQRALALDRYVTEYPAALANLTAREWDIVSAVRYERDRFEAQQQKQARDRASQTAPHGRAA